MTLRRIIFIVRKELKQSVDAKTKNRFPYYFKEKVKFHSVKSAAVNKIAKDNWQKIKHLNKAQIFALCEQLLKSGYCEEAWIAANWVYWLKQDYKPSDLKVFERWIDKYIDNWAECDNLCNHAVGEFIEQYPKSINQLKIWAKSKNMWLRRAAAVSLILPARNGKFLPEIFQISDILLTDKQDLVQKGYGWMLKEASKKHQKQVVDYVMKNKRIMPRTALRYAIEKLPLALRKQAMSRN